MARACSRPRAPDSPGAACLTVGDPALLYAPLCKYAPRRAPLLPKGVEFWAINTDAQALAHHSAPNKLQIGSQVRRRFAAARRAQRRSLHAMRRLGAPFRPLARLFADASVRRLLVPFSPAPRSIRAPQVTRGLGCGGNPELGRHAAQESQEALKKVRRSSLVGRGGIHRETPIMASQRRACLGGSAHAMQLRSATR